MDKPVLVITIEERDGLTISAQIGQRVVMERVTLTANELSDQVGRLVMGLAERPVCVVEVRWSEE